MAHDGNTHAHLRRLAPERPWPRTISETSRRGGCSPCRWWRSASARSRVRRARAAQADRAVHEPLLLPALGHRHASSPAGNHLGLLVVAIPVVGALIIGADGALRLGAHPRPRHPRSDRVDPHQRQPRRAARRAAQAAVVGDLDRLRRPVRRRRTDHHDRRRVRLADRAALPPDRAPSARRCSSPARRPACRRRSRRRSPRSCSPSSCCSSSGSRAASSRSRWRAPTAAIGAPVPPRARAALPGAAASARSSARPGWRAASLAGLLAGVLSALLTVAVYACEDLFQKLPIHWMWWPAHRRPRRSASAGSSSRRRSASATT